jgi:NAD(P)-dependent dehydrogenase (short-subunit alcohol dehydrogenase family)
MSFGNKTVVITGVGRAGQVGEAVAAAFAREGAAVVLVDRDRAQVEERASALLVHHERAIGHACDLTDAAAVQALAGRVGEAFGGSIDALVNVAGGFAMSGPVGEADVAVLRRQLDINLVTAFNASRAFVPLLRPRGGSAVYFASAAVLPGGSVAAKSGYAAAKAGVLAIMRAVAEEEHDRDVRANAVAPTNVRTGDNVAAMGEGQRYVERETVAEAVVWLCSDAARAVTGQVVQLG